MIQNFRTRFQTDPVSFAIGQLKRQRMDALRHGEPWEPFELGDPLLPLSRPVVYAEVNAANLGGRLQIQGRWIALCPNPDCAGAEYVDFGSLLFMCCCCYNAAFDHQWLSVEVPKDRELIEAVLELRHPENRFYLPGESVEDLWDQNLRNGINMIGGC